MDIAQNFDLSDGMTVLWLAGSGDERLTRRVDRSPRVKPAGSRDAAAR